MSWTFSICQLIFQNRAQFSYSLKSDALSPYLVTEFIPFTPSIPLKIVLGMVLGYNHL